LDNLLRLHAFGCFAIVFVLKLLSHGCLCYRSQLSATVRVAFGGPGSTQISSIVFLLIRRVRFGQIIHSRSVQNVSVRCCNTYEPQPLIKFVASGASHINVKPTHDHWCCSVSGFGTRSKSHRCFQQLKHIVCLVNFAKTKGIIYFVRLDNDLDQSLHLFDWHGLRSGLPHRGGHLLVGCDHPFWHRDTQVPVCAFGRWAWRRSRH
jgi:hypothetical protein